MAQWTSETFLARFVLPLVAGGEMHIGQPIDISDFKELEDNLAEASTPLIAIDEARENVLSDFVVSVPPFIFDVDELSLAAAVHNLLYLVHPQSEGWGLSERNRAKIVATAQSFASRPRTQNISRILARHALLHNFFDISRTDLLLSWWTGKAKFVGQQAPQRLLRWRNMRRVEEVHNTVPFRDLFAGADVSAVMVSLLRRSPLTMLLDGGQHSMHLHWEDVVFLLRDAEMARTLAYQCLESKQSKDVLLLAARYADSFEQMLHRSPQISDLRTVIAFLIHLNCLFAMKETSLIENRSPLLAMVLEDKPRIKGINVFLALPAVMEKVDTRLAKPPGLSTHTRWAEVWAAHRTQVFENIGEKMIEGLVERLSRHLIKMVKSSERTDAATTR